MAVKTVKNLKPMENWQFMNRVRSFTNSDYQQRVPEATKAQMADSIAAITEYRPNFNAFVDVLLNRIALVEVRNQVWSNPLSVFKRGMLTHGETIQEIQVGLLKAYTHDPQRDTTEQELLGRNLPEVQANYHSLNRADKYKVTLDEPELRKAFLEEGGLSKFTTALVNSLTTSDEFDEFLIMTNLISEFDKMNGFYSTLVPDVAAITSGTADSKALLRSIKQHTATLAFPSDLYNAARMPTFATPERMVFITTPEVVAALDVEAFAALFNMDKAEIPTRVIVVSKESVPIDGFQGLLTTEDFFICADSLLETQSFYSPAGLYTNLFLHHWGVYSTSRFVPAVLFSSVKESPVGTIEYVPTTIGDIVVTDRDGGVVTAIERGEFYQASVTIATVPVGGDNDGVFWTIAGNDHNASIVTQIGVIHIHNTDPTASVTITATSSSMGPQDTPLTADAILAVTGPVAGPWPVPEA